MITKAQAVDNFSKGPRSFALFESWEHAHALPPALPPPALRSRSVERPPPSVPFGSSAPWGKSASCGLMQPARSHADCCDELLEHQDGHQRIIKDLHDSSAKCPVNLHGTWKIMEAYFKWYSISFPDLPTGSQLPRVWPVATWTCFCTGTSTTLSSYSICGTSTTWQGQLPKLSMPNHGSLGVWGKGKGIAHPTRMMSFVSWQLPRAFPLVGNVLGNSKRPQRPDQPPHIPLLWMNPSWTIGTFWTFWTIGTCTRLCTGTSTTCRGSKLRESRRQAPHFKCLSENRTGTQRAQWHPLQSLNLPSTCARRPSPWVSPDLHIRPEGRPPSSVPFGSSAPALASPLEPPPLVLRSRSEAPATLIPIRLQKINHRP